jgi:hypothetical protein
MHSCKCHARRMTTTLKIEHAIVSFETWKRAFERDPIGRKQLGVLRYRVCRPLDDPNYVIIDLDFDRPAQAQVFLERLREVWSRVDLSPGLSRTANPEPPKARIVEEIETLSYGS